MYILCDLFRKYADVDMIIILGNAPLKGEGGGGTPYDGLYGASLPDTP